MDLTVLGCSGSYGAPRGGACSGYLLRTGGVTLWIDCGSGTFANLQQHAEVAEIDAVVVTHAHPDHSVDVYGLHVMYRYGLERGGLPVYAPEDVELGLRSLVYDDWGDTFDWNAVADGDRVTVKGVDLRFSRTDHPVHTLALELKAEDKRFVYTSDTGPGWSAEVFESGADLLLSEASYVHRDIRSPIHLSAKQAGEAARAAKAKRLVLTHVWPTVDTAETLAEGSEAFGATVDVASPHTTYTI